MVAAEPADGAVDTSSASTILGVVHHSLPLLAGGCHPPRLHAGAGIHQVPDTAPHQHLAVIQGDLPHIVPLCTNWHCVLTGTNFSETKM